jgi:hypothetical protein
MKVSRSGFFLSIVCTGAVLFLFQNCSPAKLNGDTASMSVMGESPNLGSVIDLTAILAAAAKESSSNILYPSGSAIPEYDYAADAQIIESILLKNNDFNTIEWIHAASSTVVASGLAFNQKKFSADLLGTYYVIGYRGDVPYLIAQFKIVNKGSSTLGVNSAGAVVVSKSTISSDATNESILITVDAPAVDLKSIQFTQGGQVTSGRRAILVTKKIADEVVVEIKLTDMSGQTYTQNLTLDAPPPAAPAPIASYSTTSVDFGSIPYSSFNTTTRNVVITNNGNAPLTFSSVTVTGTDFRIARSCDSPVAVGASCTIALTFTPFGGPGNITQSLRVNTNAQPALTTIPVKVNVTPF